MKRINPGTVSVVVMAIMFGLIATYVVRQSMNKTPLLPPPDPIETKSSQRVVVAGTNIPKGTLLSNRNVQVTYVAADKEMPEGFFRYSPAAVGRYTINTLKAGAAITESDLLPIGEGLPSKASEIPPGHRAIAVNIDNASIRDILEIGSYVDVTLSIKGDDIEVGGIQTRTLLHAAKVIDIEKTDKRRTTNRMGVTLAVTPQDANLLVTAQETGSLNLTLVSPNEEAVANGDPNLATKFGSIFPERFPPVDPPEPPPVVEVPEAQPYVLEVWKGSKRTLVELPAYTIEEARRASVVTPISITPSSNTAPSQPEPTDSTQTNLSSDDALFVIGTGE